jgi:hypothetical protein
MAACCMSGLACLAGCTDDEPSAATKADLLRWLETENSDVEQGDPACVVELMWDANLTDFEVEQFSNNDVAPDRIDVYANARDECNYQSLALQCRSGDRFAIECIGIQSNPWEGVTVLDYADLPGGVLAPCAEWRSRDVIEDEVVWGCTDGEYGDATLGIYRCDDGRLLYSISSGSWGYVGEPMRDQISQDPDVIGTVDDMSDCTERLFPDPST